MPKLVFLPSLSLIRYYSSNYLECGFQGIIELVIRYKVTLFMIILSLDGNLIAAAIVERAFEPCMVSLGGPLPNGEVSIVPEQCFYARKDEGEGEGRGG